ncbi:MAG TPA: phosphoribosylamine--glycine ligase [Candidatus Tectomicrobia bacterium]|nr:phosphoribosylamine--glycine ligase [Candidatus Tectomicrobia bacterium]
MKPAVIGKDGRTTAIRNALLRSPRVEGDVPVLSDGKNFAHPETQQRLLEAARDCNPDFVVVGPEEPLKEGVVDSLQKKLGIRCVGPTQNLARLETSKSYTRELLSRHGIPGNPRFQIFTGENAGALERYLASLDGFVIKPDGLTGGKGVKVSGSHLKSLREGLEYAEALLRADRVVIIEEKLDGEEFSLQSFCDGVNVVHMPAVQDHKRAWENDEGPNTGGMGSYSDTNHRLPFLAEEHLRAAREINAAVARALYRDTGERYKGILYGGFMVTRDGVRLLEYNARFGDPEALNVLSILTSDFAAICAAILEGSLHPELVDFARLATVCKYVVPSGYPDQPTTGAEISLRDVPPESARLKHYPASLDTRDGRHYLTGSRAIAFVGIGPTLEDAERIAEEAASAVEGPVFHRRDIGTRRLVDARCRHMSRLLA